MRVGYATLRKRRQIAVIKIEIGYPIAPVSLGLIERHVGTGNQAVGGTASPWMHRPNAHTDGDGAMPVCGQSGLNLGAQTLSHPAGTGAICCG